MSLRAWQSECVDLAMGFYNKKRHFLCLATPGAGKTTMAAELAGRLLQRGDIDFILCFAPSLAIADGIKQTFSCYLGLRFDGLVGAVGGAYTYQGMRGLGDHFWNLLDSHQVFVIFDEIHHCSGRHDVGFNTWGEEILRRVQHKAAYTLALTGTPWRSDNHPIVLSEYSGPEGFIKCDYTYGLPDAIRDGVCRKPSIVLIDNDRLRLTCSKKNLEYSGVGDLLQRSDVRYQKLLHNKSALHFCISLACSQLDSIRLCTPNAGGLVVASSVEHAENIAYLLKNEFKKSVCVVSYQHKGSREIIEQFLASDQEWIVSVGMVSEGTDIPRLQVCCHLSRITTELYFRQVLGRVLRTTRACGKTAWLYTFAEPALIQYAERIADEIPGEYTLNYKMLPENYISTENSVVPKDGPRRQPVLDLDADNWLSFGSDEQLFTGFPLQIEPSIAQLECLGEFRQRVIGFFQKGITMSDSSL